MFHELVIQQITAFKHCLRKRFLRSCVYDRALAMCSMINNTQRHMAADNCIRKPEKIMHLRRGLYSVFLADYLSVFPRDQILVHRLEDMSDDREHALNTTYAFLGLR
ncbi:CHSTF-like protein, partial [Mya arenaria]